MTSSPRPPWVLPAALLAVAIAFGATAVRVLSALDDSFRYAGDQAVFGVAVHEASVLDRELGPYSRYGWSHPGPFWFYLLAPATRLLGGDDAALVAATVLVNGLLAAAVVGAVHRAGRPVLTLVTTGLVLLLVLRLPAVFFVEVWSPFALLMGTLLFLALVARLHSGSWSALLAALIAGSFLVQTHVGTAPLVALVAGAGLVGFALARRGARRAVPQEGTTGPAGGRSSATGPRAPVVALAVLLVAVWLPPVLQQLTSPSDEGNLRRLLHFFTVGGEDGASPSLPDAAAAVGRLLAMTPYGWGPGPYEMEVGALPAPVLLALAAQALASVVLVVLGARLARRPALWWGVVTLLALIAAVASAATVTGVLYWYLIIWVAVLPIATLIGYAHLALALDRGDGGRAGTPGRTAVLDRPAALVAVAGVVLAGGAAVALSLGDAADDLPASPGVAAASGLVDGALRDVEQRAVHVDIETPELWPIGAGVVHGLVQDGWRVSVDDGSEELFGPGRVSAGTEPVDVIVVSTDSPAHDRLRGDGGVTDLGAVATELGPTSVLVRIED